MSVVDDVLMSQFKYMKQVMENGEFKGYLAIHLGKFVVSEARLYRYLQNRYYENGNIKVPNEVIPEWIKERLKYKLQDDNVA